MVRRLAKVGLPKDFQADSLGTYSFEAFKNLPGIEGHVQTRKDVGKEEITGWFHDEEKIKEKESEIWDCLTKKYSVNALGMVGFYEFQYSCRCCVGWLPGLHHPERL